MPLPDGMSAHDAMAIGTAGYTAMLCVIALERHGIVPDRGPVVVTGAAGGVGSVAVSILSSLGYHVIASTGRNAESPYLTDLGAAEVISRDELAQPAKPLAKERWAGGVDAVGSHTLANVLSMTSYGGAVAACGLAGGMDLPASVAPFILRGVSLLGIDSVMAPKAVRIEAWRRVGDRSRSSASSPACPRPSASRASSMPRTISSTARSAAVSWWICKRSCLFLHRRPRIEVGRSWMALPPDGSAQKSVWPLKFERSAAIFHNLCLAWIFA